MASPPTHYDTLGVAQGAGADAIKAAYRRLARQFHPDVNPGNPAAEARFKKVGEAYATLSDAERRQAYDETLSPSVARANTANPRARTAQEAKPRPKTASPPPAPKPSPKPSPAPAHNSGFKDMFDTLFGKDAPAPAREPSPRPAPSPPPPPPPAPKPSRAPRRGEDVTVEATLNADEAHDGAVKTVNVEHAEPCRRCSATGKINGIACPVCHGDRQLVTLRKIDVRLPAGVKTGAKIRVAKEGGRGLDGGESGDLFLVVKIAATDSALRIDGVNVHYELALSIPEAVLGAEISVPTLHGPVKLLVPPLTSSGQVLRMKGQGAHLSTATGDQLVTIKIAAPKSLTVEEKALYQELAKFRQN